MNRACRRSIVLSLSFALMAMTFMIATTTRCSTTSHLSFARGPFCSVEHTSSTKTGNTTPEMNAVQELAFVIAAGFVLMLWSKRISLEILSWTIGRVRSIRRIRGEPTALRVFLPQIFASHGN